MAPVSGRCPLPTAAACRSPKRGALTPPPFLHTHTLTHTRPHRHPLSSLPGHAQVNDWYVGFGKWQTRVFVEPHYDKWAPDQRDGLDAWILQECLPAGALEGLDGAAAAGALAAARWHLFPRLDPAQADKTVPAHDLLPELRDVQVGGQAGRRAKGQGPRGG